MVDVVGVLLAGFLDWENEKRNSKKEQKDKEKRKDNLSVISVTDPLGRRESIVEREGLVKVYYLRHTNLLLDIANNRV